MKTPEEASKTGIVYDNDGGRRCAQHDAVNDDVSSQSNTDATNKTPDTTTMKLTKIVKRAVIPTNLSDSSDIFDRHCLHGGPVKVATIRFPPPPPIEWIGGTPPTADGSSNTKTQQQPDVPQARQDRYNSLKSQGRIVFARGPWIESHPLFPYDDDNDDAKKYSNEATSSSSLEENKTNSKTQRDCSSNNNDERCYKILAFGGANRGSSTFESVHGMIFPSSSSSLTYLKEANSKSSSSSRSNSRSSSSSLISVVAYGGRRMSFLSGGGLWNNNASGGTISSGAEANFAPISIMRRSNKQGQAMAQLPYLEVSDWIHDVRLLDVDSTGSSKAAEPRVKESISKHFLIAMGMANNNCEIWGFHMITIESGNNDLVLYPTRLQCITCSVRCMTYSLSFFGWENEREVNSFICSSYDNCVDNEESIALPSLVAASGTVFGEVVVWGAVVGNLNDQEEKSQMENGSSLQAIVKQWLSDNMTNISISANYPPHKHKTSRIRVVPIHHLKGHLGSVFSVKFGACGNYIASTSDDRSVRLWALAPINESETTTNVGDDDDNMEMNKIPCTKNNAQNILSLEPSHEYTLVWTGWGHTARVWDVSFASPSSSQHPTGVSFPLLVSAGEDSTARIWSPLSSTKEVAHPLRGHRCESLWTVDVCEGIIITGGNDGCVKLFELESRVRPEKERVTTFVVPKDPRPTTPVIADGGLGTDQSSVQEKNEADTTSNSTKSRKKKKRKTKPNGQAIFGMEFYGSPGKVHSKLLVATRAGGLFSLDLMSSIWTDHGSWSEKVVSSADHNEMVNINPTSGSCIGVHPSGECVVIGTTEGWLVVSSLSKSALTDQSHSTLHDNVAFHAPSYRPVQSASFVDNDSLLVFYSRGSVIWFKFGDSPIPMHVMTLGTAGIPLSFAYNNEDQAMYIGDSRGNIVFFDLSLSCPSTQGDFHGLHERKPSSLLAKVHEKEHVTGITVLKSTGVIVSVGNDGCMHHCTRDAKTGQLQRMISIPIPSVTGLKHVWNVLHPNGVEGVILSGFYGNEFVMLDSINGYEFVRIATGGRQRRQDFFFSFSNDMASIRCPNIFGMAILTGQKDGQTEIDFHCSHSFEESLAITSHDFEGNMNIKALYSVGSPVHSETINDACWVKGCGSTYLLTGSNDCTVKLSKLENNDFVSVMELPAHESCVRGVCSSRHPSSDSTLLATCGGKLSVNFYILDHTSPTKTAISKLCSYRTLGGKATIDLRMNAVHSTPLRPHNKQCHLVMAGDSDGNLHLCVVSEHAVVRRTIIGTILKGNGRPMLCLELSRWRDKILAFAGTTGGEIAVWVLPGSVDLNDEADGVHSLEGTIPAAPAHIFRAHQTGVNDLSVAIAMSHTSKDGFNAVICSVGDDQSLSTCVIDFIHPKEGRLYITQSASASALKAVKLVTEKKPNFYRLYTTGHDEQITLWHLDANPSQLSIKSVSSSPLGTEGSCIDCVHLEQSDGSVHEVIAVGGEGVELQSLNLNILQAATRLRDANYLLITTGAGFSADSGLQTYECAPAEYRDMCNVSNLTDKPDQFQQFWLAFTQSYLDKQPHKGYELLDLWCHGGRLQHLKRQPNKIDEPWWVYSSNVDGHFRLFESFSKHSSLCEIHGSALEFKCACGIGYTEGEPRLGMEWDLWNKKMNPTDSCKQTTVQINQTLLMDISNSGETFLCEHCQSPMRPNVLMFHDTDENVLKAINAQRERYQAWEGQVEEEVAMNGGSLVILEIGCGLNVPAVRQESEEVLLDCTEKMRSQSHGSHGSACLIRINPKDADIEMDSVETIPISLTAVIALHKIDCWLKSFAASQDAM